MFISVILMALSGYFGFLIGRRWEAGEAEAELDLIEEQAYQRSRRRGSLVLSTIRLRR